MSYKRNQIEEAIARIFAPHCEKPPSELRTRIKRLLELKHEDDIQRDDYITVVAKLERDFLAGVQTNIRSRTFAIIWANLRVLLQTGYTTTRRLGALYEAQLYSRVEDGRGDQPRHLHELLVKPRGESAEFKPKYDNWRRAAKVPVT